MSAEPDVAIIGAGAAGLAAARTLKETGQSFVVLEAKDRAGGRANTDFATFGVPWDRGCHWLHSASVNPFTALAERYGFSTMRLGARRARRLYLGSGRASDAERDEAWDAILGAFDAADAAGLAGRDIPASKAIDLDGRWGRLIRHWFALMSSFPPEEISTRDLAAYEDTVENWPVGDGYGALVLRHAEGIAVRLETPVRRVDWSGAGVRLETDRGTLAARAAIVTCSTNVIATGAIRFLPELPAAKMHAFAATPVGHAEKVAFLFDRQVFDVDPTSYSDTIDPADPSRPPINFTLRPFGHEMAIGQLAGHVARDLLAEGERAMTEFALAALMDAFGSDLRRRIARSAVTGWSADPWILGAYSCARPGHAHMRALLGESEGGRLFFAGEATSPGAFSTCHGAHQSGMRAAGQAIAALRATRPAAAE